MRIDLRREPSVEAKQGRLLARPSAVSGAGPHGLLPLGLGALIGLHLYFFRRASPAGPYTESKRVRYDRFYPKQLFKDSIAILLCFAWLIWMSLHLFLILGVKNKFLVFFNWVYNYFTYDQSLRLIFPEFYKTEKANK